MYRDSNDNCSRHPSSNLRKSCFCYLLTSTLVGIFVYTIVILCIRSMNKLDILQEEVAVIYNKLSKLGKKSEHDSTGENDRWSEEALGNAVKKFSIDLQNNILEAKRVLSKMDCAIRNTCVDNTKTQNYAPPDYASEILGGKIEYVEDEKYSNCNYILSVFCLCLTNTARNILNRSMEPGNCYAFKGTKSIVVIKLIEEIYIKSVSISHISSAESPSGKLDSAPKDFSVYGLKSAQDEKGFYFGLFTYDAYSGEKEQNFVFTTLSKESHRYIKFNFTTNHGHPDYTCVYRISVHGTPRNKMLN